MATCLECSGTLPEHRPGCDTPAVEQRRRMDAEGRGTTGNGFVTWEPPSQPSPTGNGPEVLPVALRFLTQRQEHGARKYGTTLRAHNGRSALRDAKEEAADQLMYLTQLEMEWPATVAQIREQAISDALQLVELQLQAEPAQVTDELGRIAVAVNGALRRVYAGLRELRGAPSHLELEAVRTGPRRGLPRKKRKPHRWVGQERFEDGGPKRWTCKDCPLERRWDATQIVYRVGDQELARGSLGLTRVPTCPPAPKGDR